MMAIYLRWLALGLVLALIKLPLSAQQVHADRKLLADIQRGAESGEADSQFELGRAFLFGELGIVKDEAKAVEWWHKAAEQNYLPAQFFLGHVYGAGQGVAQDHEKAVYWWRKAAEQNHPQAQANLGHCYAFGLGVARDDGEAVKWYRKAAERNNEEAQFNLGVFYATGRGVVKDSVEAVKWYRKAAERGDAGAQANLAICYQHGDGVDKDLVQAERWHRLAAMQGHASAQFNVGLFCANGVGEAKNDIEAVRWYRMAADQGEPNAQSNLGTCYMNGSGVAKNIVEAVKWFRKAAEQGYAEGQFNLATCWYNGDGVTKDYVEAHRWWNLSAAQGDEDAKTRMHVVERQMTRDQIADAQRMARGFKPRKDSMPDKSDSGERIVDSRPTRSGSGFFISDSGYFISNEHVIRNAAQIRLVTSVGLISAKVVKVDAANDLALLKAEGRFTGLPVAASRGVKLGGTVATVGFPNIGLQGFAPKLAKGEIASLSGAQDDARYFQISVPVQPGNSGGALVDERGNVVGVVSARLSDVAALRVSGSLPQNVNYAVKSSYLLSFLESVPEVAAKLKEPESRERKFEEVVKAAEQAAVLVLVY